MTLETNSIGLGCGAAGRTWLSSLREIFEQQCTAAASAIVDDSPKLLDSVFLSLVVYAAFDNKLQAEPICWEPSRRKGQGWLNATSGAVSSVVNGVRPLKAAAENLQIILSAEIRHYLRSSGHLGGSERAEVVQRILRDEINELVRRVAISPRHQQIIAEAFEDIADVVNGARRS